MVYSFAGAIPHGQACSFLQRGQIFLNASLTESFCIAIVGERTKLGSYMQCKLFMLARTLIASSSLQRTGHCCEVDGATGDEI